MSKDYWYGTHYKGEYTNVYPLEDCLRAIACRNEDKQRRIDYLEQKVKELEDEHYKDKRLQELTEELNKVRADAHRSFSISEQEEQAISAWKREHEKTVHPGKRYGAIGGGYEYSFYPTSIGDIGDCYCSACRNKAIAEAGVKWHERLKELGGVFNFSDL